VGDAISSGSAGGIGRGGGDGGGGGGGGSRAEGDEDTGKIARVVTRSITKTPLTSSASESDASEVRCAIEMQRVGGAMAGDGTHPPRSVDVCTRQKPPMHVPGVGAHVTTRPGKCRTTALTNPLWSLSDSKVPSCRWLPGQSPVNHLGITQRIKHMH
jgi:hypothetical protein